MNDATQLVGLLLEEDGAWDFTTLLDQKHVSVTGEPDNWYLTHGSTTVKWHLDIDARQWGVKEFAPSLIEVRVTLEFDVDNSDEGLPDSTETVELTYPTGSQGAAPVDDVKAAVDHYAASVQAEIEYNVQDNFPIGMSPVDVEIDLRTNQIKVFF